MALNVKFLKGTQEEYNNVAVKDSNTFYYLSDVQELYLGTIQLSNESSSDDLTEVINRLAAAESSIESLQSDVETAQGDISTLQSSLETTQSDVSTLQTDVETAQDSISSLQSDVETLQTSSNDGVGIANIEQTTSSNESSGINIWTITLTDGREFIFTIYNGDNGASAYEVAVANGYEGTEAEWLESLKGADETSLPDASECRDGTILTTLDGEWVMLHMGLENITEEAF